MISLGEIIELYLQSAKILENLIPALHKETKGRACNFHSFHKGVFWTLSSI